MTPGARAAPLCSNHPRSLHKPGGAACKSRQAPAAFKDLLLGPPVLHAAAGLAPGLACSMLKKTGCMIQYWKPAPMMARISPCSSEVSRMPPMADMRMATTRPSLLDVMPMNE